MHNFFLVAYFSLLIGLSLHGLHTVWLLFQRARHPRVPTPAAYPPHRPELPRVTIQLPLYNEKAVADRLLRAVAEFDYPREKLQIQVLDDSTDETSDILRRGIAHYRKMGIPIHYLHRAERVGYKAGALREGLARATGEFIAIFDADFVPSPDFLLRVLPCFEDPTVGMTQVRWGHLNERHSWLTRLQALFLDGHFVMESETRDRAGLFLTFNGTAGIWRKTCIEQAGGWQDDTLTEDLDLSYRAQLAGWKFRFLCDCEAAAELPQTVQAFKSQQYRWTRGQVETLRKLGGVFAARPLPWRIKLEVFFHLTNHWVFPGLVLLSLCAYPALSIRFETTVWKLLSIDLPLYLLGIFSVNSFYFWGQRVLYPKRIGRLLGIPGLLFLGTGLAVSNTMAVWEGYRGRNRSFVRTPKTGDHPESPYGSQKSGAAAFEVGLAAYLFFCIWDAAQRGVWAAIPFLLVFALGFGAIGLASVAEECGKRHRGGGRGLQKFFPYWCGGTRARGPEGQAAS